MTNKFAGVCKCKAQVAAGAGSVSKVRGKWLITCAAYSTVSTPAPSIVRVMDGTIEWPNGWGYTECTAAYSDAHFAAQLARQALNDFDEAHKYDENHPDRPDLYNAACRAEYEVTRMQIEGGHIGDRVTYDRPDVATALLGGGSITVRPGGDVHIA